MKAFAELYRRLDETTKTSRKVAAMVEYFAAASPKNAAWAVYFLSGRKINRLVKVASLRSWCLELTGYDDWLFDECYGVVGDLAETIALLLERSEESVEHPLADWIEHRLLPLQRLDEAAQRELVFRSWQELGPQSRFVYNKLMTGSFRVGVSHGLVVRAVSRVSGVPAAVIAHRLMGTWEPTEEFFRRLTAPDDGEADGSRPYPFCLAHPLEGEPDQLGNPSDWQAEWKWDGIRAQLVRRGGQSYLWSRGEELMLDRFPEIAPAAEALPDGTVLDGELVAWKDGAVLPFGELQRRIGRKTVGKKLLADVPAHLIAFDLLEDNGRDIREVLLRERRERLESLLGEVSTEDRIFPSPLQPFESWDDLSVLRQSSREQNVEGLMLKRLDAPYGVGRVTGLWWKWKIEPYTVDAVLIYAQPGHGRRANLYTDYTFAAWHEGELVPFAKAYSGLTDEEFRRVDRFVRQNTVERFGPVRSVKPELVFELAFENIRISKRHKSGLAVRFPRMVRWRTDKRPDDADSIDRIRSMLPAESDE